MHYCEKNCLNVFIYILREKMYNVNIFSKTGF